MLLLLLAGGLFAWLCGGMLARWLSLAVLTVDLGLSVAIAFGAPATFARPWLPLLGSTLHLTADGLSAVLLVLTMTLGLLAVIAGWREIDERAGMFHFVLLWCLAGVTGVFIAVDLLVFYFFWELMLVPMYLLIGIWGHAGRARAALRFALFSQAGGLALLVAIVALAAERARQTGVWSFDYHALLGAHLAPRMAMLLMLGFLAAFLVTLPAVPLHTWLADAHTEAPTPASVVLAGLMLKTGAYGIVRFALPLFPDASRAFAPFGLALGAVGVVYGALLAIAQTDLKRLVAYTSVSHMGFVLLGAYAMSPRGLAGVVLQLVCHGLATGGMFVVVGLVEARTGTRDLTRLGGLWRGLPRLAAVATVLAMASLGLPGLGNFAAELLVLLGAFAASPAPACLAATAMVLASLYALRFVQRPFQGPLTAGPTAALIDIEARELAAFAVLVGLLFWIGLWPMHVLRVAGLGGAP